MDQYKKRGYFLAMFGAIFWAVSGSCGQYLFMYKEFSSDLLVPIRLFLAGILLLSFSFIKQKKEIFNVWKDKRSVLDLLIFGVLGMAMCQYSYFTSIAYSNAGTATVLSYLGPVLIIVYIAFRNHKLPSLTESTAVILALIGTFLLATHGNIHSLSISKEGLIWGLLAALALAIYSIQPQRIINIYGTLAVTGWGMLIGGSLLCVIFRPWQLHGIWDGTTFLFMSLIILFGTVISFTSYLEGVKRIGPTKGSILSSIEPIFSTILTILWLKVSFQWIDFVAFAMIISTIFLLALEKPKESVSKTEAESETETI